MARTRRKFDENFKAGADRIVRVTGKPVAQVARELGSTRKRWALVCAGSGGPAMPGTAR
jgi:transposase-like protein